MKAERGDMKMAIKINLESTKIPVEIGDLNFEINVTDEKFDTFSKHFQDFLNNVQALDEQNEEDQNKLKPLVKSIHDELLGLGSFELVYEKVPNVTFVAGILIKIVSQLTEEMDKRIMPTNQMNNVHKIK